MKEEIERRSKPGYEKSYWCCAADFGSHESDCPNFVPVAPAPTASAIFPTCDCEPAAPHSKDCPITKWQMAHGGGECGAMGAPVRSGEEWPADVEFLTPQDAAKLLNRCISELEQSERDRKALFDAWHERLAEIAELHGQLRAQCAAKEAAEAYASSQSEKLAGVGQQAAEEIYHDIAVYGVNGGWPSKESIAVIIDRVIAGRVKP